MQIIELDFKKTSDAIETTSYAHVDLHNSENLKNIEKYILPIIVENEGWGTGDVTLEGFRKDPQQYQDALDASLFANVHVAIDDNSNPLGLIEFLVEDLENPVSKVRMDNLKNLIEIKSSWDKLKEMNVVNSELIENYFSQLNSFLVDKKIYSEIGLVVRPDLQGKKSGVSEKLYELISDGISFGWTNNPVIISKRRERYRNVLYFPLFGEKIESLEDLACIAILYADLLTYEKGRWVNYEFGAITSPYFVSSRDAHYLDLAKSLHSKGKITELDVKRIIYCLERKSVQGAIFAY